MNLEEIKSKLPETEGNVISVLSGGLDSSIMTYVLVDHYGKDRVKAISYNYNQKQSEELKRASLTTQYLGIEHKILDLSVLGEIAKGMSANIQGTDVNMPTIKEVLGDPTPKTYVPFRNMILNSIAFSFAESNKAEYIFSGLQSTDSYGYWDTTADFVNRMNNVSMLSRNGWPRLVAPFASITKTDEIAIANELGNVKFDLTLTCYNPDNNGKSCGKCPSCSERIQAFMKHKMIDPVEYQIDIPWNK